jgi:hypothetical protein
MIARVIVLIPNDSFADVMMHRPRYSPEVVPAERVSMMLEYLMERVQSTPELRARELRESVSRACELIATRNDYPGKYPYGGTKPTYTDEIILNAFKNLHETSHAGTTERFGYCIPKQGPEFRDTVATRSRLCNRV